jgi:hypothetical protein
MIIERCEFSREGDGFIVNRNLTVNDASQFYVPDDMANRHRVVVQEWIDDGGVVGPYVDPMTPYQHWHNNISKLDKDMPRSLEDMLDGMADKSGVNQISLDRLQAKKDLRATKP